MIFSIILKRKPKRINYTSNGERKKNVCIVYVFVSKSSSFINDICMHKNATQKDQKEK